MTEIIVSIVDLSRARIALVWNLFMHESHVNAKTIQLQNRGNSVMSRSRHIVNTATTPPRRPVSPVRQQLMADSLA